ncbi:hypothetical protein [Streptomyces sp. BBFR109]|uniref:hypothetical protein n=1 Tax=Streptomyces sp. BBFR109 TaxID=3448172 RepID=UPI003F7630B2
MTWRGFGRLTAYYVLVGLVAAVVATVAAIPFDGLAASVATLDAVVVTGWAASALLDAVSARAGGGRS